MSDEWVEVDESVRGGLPKGARVRVQHDWVVGDENAYYGSRVLVHRDDLGTTDPDTEAVYALRDASWNVPRFADGSRPDPLPGLPEARELLTALREVGFDVVPYTPERTRA